MRITIVTPSFNQARYIEEAVWSVKNQGYPDIEHIVVDGASSDGTVELLQRYAALPGWEHLRWISEPDGGQSEALNKGFRLSSGDVVGWLNSDDRYRHGCFATILRGVHEHPVSDVLYGDYTWIDEQGRLLQVRRETAFSLFVLRYHRMLYIPSTATFFRRRIFDDGNFVDLTFHYAMDYEFFLRLALKGYHFQHLSHVLADFRWHSQSKSGSAATKQLDEHNRAALMHSRLLQTLPEGFARRSMFRCLRMAAAARRYAEKGIRGYYLEQFWPSAASNEVS